MDKPARNVECGQPEQPSDDDDGPDECKHVSPPVGEEHASSPGGGPASPLLEQSGERPFSDDHQSWERLTARFTLDRGACWRSASLPPRNQAARRVEIRISDVSVRWTGQRFAICSRRSRCTWSSGPCRTISRSMESSARSWVSQLAQSSAWIFSWRRRTSTSARGQPLCCAYIRSVIAVHAPSAASSR